MLHIIVVLFILAIVSVVIVVGLPTKMWEKRLKEKRRLPALPQTCVSCVNEEKIKRRLLQQPVTPCALPYSQKRRRI